MFQLEYFDEPAGKWRLVGEDGNAFERPSLAWDEAVEVARIGAPYDGARFRVTAPAQEHRDDCSLGIGGLHCDCNAEAIVALEGTVSVKNGMVQSSMSVGKLSPVPFTVTQRFSVDSWEKLS